MIKESDWVLVEEKSDLKKLETNFDNLQIKFKEEKEKAVNLENELKEMNKKIQKINSNHKNEIEEIKQNFQKLIEENDVCLKQKDEKINSLEENIKKANDLFEKKIVDLTIKLNDITCKELVNYIKIKNKWSEIFNFWKCCDINCINTYNPIGNCIEGNGFANIVNDENIKYINCLEGKGCDKNATIFTQTPFNTPQNYFNYSLYYFEIKCKFESKLNKSWINFGLQDCSTLKYIGFIIRNPPIILNDKDAFKLENISFNNYDTFGCGLVYPPAKKTNEEFPYIFFTQNGKQIGKGILTDNNFVSYKQYIALACCSIEANFGSDLGNNPFKYDISKHEILKEFY
uniref:Uncharacterized protein n=1 Tax=Meloidogyne enterolobii TaxID=390850 RepID=A0A6V7U9A1_MELEN|nr:unnamed protein product [Meloidogyne enterolobii]